MINDRTKEKVSLAILEALWQSMGFEAIKHITAASLTNAADKAIRAYNETTK